MKKNRRDFNKVGNFICLPTCVILFLRGHAGSSVRAPEISRHAAFILALILGFCLSFLPPALAGGLTTSGARMLGQGLDGLAGNNETGDGFGSAIATGDFNGDGYPDAVFGTPDEDLNSDLDTGDIHVIYGSSNGLEVAATLQHPATRHYWQSNFSSPWQAGARFGASLAVGDFNGDGYADLAVGSPGYDVSGYTDAGRVDVRYGSSSGLGGGGHLTLDGSGNSWVFGSGFQFGYALTSGDFNGDGADELAIGVPNCWYDSGAVNIFFGVSGSGLTTVGNYVVHEGSEGVAGDLDEDHFGKSLAAGDFNADGYDDLVVGKPDETLVVGGLPLNGAGALNIIYGSSDGLYNGSYYNSEEITSLQSGANLTSYNYHFAAALATGDFNGDGISDLVVGQPDSDIEAGASSGRIFIYLGGHLEEEGLSLCDNWVKCYTTLDLANNFYDLFSAFGSFLSSGDFNGDGLDDIAIGVPGATTSVPGGVAVIYSAQTWSSSVSQCFFQGEDGLVPQNGDTTQNNDRFGASVAGADFNNDGCCELAIGLPGASPNNTATRGGGVILLNSPSDPSRLVVEPDEPVTFTTMEGIIPDEFPLQLSSVDENSVAWQVNVASNEDDMLVVQPAEGEAPEHGTPVKIMINSEWFGGKPGGVYEAILVFRDPVTGYDLRTIAVTVTINRKLCVGSDQPYHSIQNAIDAAINGDVVLISADTYTGVGNTNLTLDGKKITVKGESGTIIDCQNTANTRAFYLDAGETPETVIQGITIKNGSANSGGGFYVGASSSPTLSGIIFSVNIATNIGGGLYYDGYNGRILNCQFLENSCNKTGGGICLGGSNILISNCYFINNNAVVGGGVFCGDGDTHIDNSQFKSNAAKGSYGTAFPVYCHGGAICSSGGKLTLSNSFFRGNYTQKYVSGEYNAGGAVFLGNIAGQSVVNSIFSGNYVLDGNGNGGAICCLGEEFSIINCTLYNNEVDGSAHGDGIYYTEQTGKIVNTVIWEDSSIAAPESIATDVVENPAVITEINSVRVTGRVLDADLSSDDCQLCNWFHNAQFMPNLHGTDPLPPPFVNPANDDFRIKLSSDPVKEYLLDKGTKVDWLYSDYRGSLRPIDGNNDGSDKFDIGALEYSLYYGGSTADSVTSAFKELRLVSSNVVINQPYEIKWQDKAPFPDLYLKIVQSGEYRVNIALVNDNGYRIDLLENKLIPLSQTGYKIPFTFGQEHIGTWRLRLEIADDPNLSLCSDEITIQYKETVHYTLGQEIHPPAGVIPGQKPDFDDPEACYWSVNSKKLFATAARFVIITWYADENRSVPIPVIATIDFPESDYITHIAETPPVNVMPAGTVYDLVELKYANNDARLSANAFSAGQEGWSLLYLVDNETSTELFRVVRTFEWDDPEVLIDNVNATIGTELSGSAYGHDTAGGAGYVFFEKSPYDGSGSSKAYDRSTRSGQILPVNEIINDSIFHDDGIDGLVVVWYKNSDGISWPETPVRYLPHWPAEPELIVIASCNGSGALDPETYGSIENMLIYNQPDRSQAGYNPNEEHAMFFTALGSSFPAVYALRQDINDATKTSKPFALLKYRDPLTNKWKMQAWQVVATTAEYDFNYDAVAGTEILPPYPLNQMLFGPCSASSVLEEDQNRVLEDKDDKIFAIYGGGTTVGATFYYKLQDGFFYDRDYDGNNDVVPGTPIPWLDGVDGQWNETPQVVSYTVNWPDNPPVLHIGETLIKAKAGLPDISSQCRVDIIYQDNNLVQLSDPLYEGSIACNRNLLTSLKPEIDLDSGRLVFTSLPAHIQIRLTYDPVSEELKLKGWYDVGTGEPTLLFNVLSQREFALVEGIVGSPGFTTVLNNLNDANRAHNQSINTSLGDADLKVLSAGNSTATGWVTLAFNNAAECSAPTELSVIQVGCPLYTGEIDVFASDNPFEEQVAMRHNGDFGGNSDTKEFQWMYMNTSEISGIPATDDPHWNSYSAVSPTADPDNRGLEGTFYIGADDTVISGGSDQLLIDKWFKVRYYDPQAENLCSSAYSAWTPPQLYEGWVKRVMKNINLFDQKIKDFHASDVDTLASMISLAGTGYEGPVALSDDPEYLQNLGIIKLYETLLARSAEIKMTTLDPAIDQGMMFAANRLADLYMLLGNEAYADAADPTIGFSTESGVYGTEAPSIFCFQNQVESLLEEELCLLRGRSEYGVRPFYNRLIWNFTLGDGEVAYAENYNITDQITVDIDGNGFPDERDGEINEDDARILYPQGHGDAWGYYLSAVKRYYYLLKTDNFTWVPQSESIIVAEVPVVVDYRDERKFAVAAAAKARAGSEVVDLTYRQMYEDGSAAQWYGYKDNDTERDWGVDSWARRAGQGALFDWVVGNALLPPESALAGIEKVDRTTSRASPRGLSPASAWSSWLSIIWKSLAISASSETVVRSTFSIPANADSGGNSALPTTQSNRAPWPARRAQESTPQSGFHKV